MPMLNLPRRRPLVFGTASVLVALGAQATIAKSNGTGWFLFAVAAALFIAAFGHIAPASMAGGGLPISRPRAGTLAHIAWPLVGLSVVAVLVAVYLFGAEATSGLLEM